MTFDKQEHKDIVLALIKQANFPGSMLEMALEVKEAVTVATVTQQEPAA